MPIGRPVPRLTLSKEQREQLRPWSRRANTGQNLAVLDARTGKVIGQTQQRHRSGEPRNFLDAIEKNVPAKLDIHLILDNYGTHKTKTIRNWLASDHASISTSNRL